MDNFCHAVDKVTVWEYDVPSEAFALENSRRRIRAAPRLASERTHASKRYNVPRGPELLITFGESLMPNSLIKKVPSASWTASLT